MFRLRRAPSYPFQAEALGAGMLFYGSFGVMFLIYLFVRAMAEQLAPIALALVAGMILIYVALLFGYGMEIVRATGEGKAGPPVLSGSMTNILEGKQRLFRQLLVVGVFSALAARLQLSGLRELSTGVWALLFVMLPAFVVHNTFYESVGAMLNPASLATTLRTLGPILPALLLVQALGVALAYFAFSRGLLLYLALFPCALYCQFLYFHLVGLRVLQFPDAFFPQVDFKADRAELKALSEQLAPLDAELSEAYEWLREGELARVLERMDLLVKRDGWNHFERLFRYLSQWPSAAPALHLCRSYLHQAEALATPMRALELAQWCVAKDAAFTLGSDTLQELADRAVVPGQYRAVLRMIENFLASHADAPERAQLLQTALNLAADKLKDEASYARLKGANP